MTKKNELDEQPMKTKVGTIKKIQRKLKLKV